MKFIFDIKIQSSRNSSQRTKERIRTDIFWEPFYFSSSGWYRRCCCIFSALLQEKKFTDWDGSETDFAVKVTRWMYINDSGQLVPGGDDVGGGGVGGSGCDGGGQGASWQEEGVEGEEMAGRQYPLTQTRPPPSANIIFAKQLYNFVPKSMLNQFLCL